MKQSAKILTFAFILLSAVSCGTQSKSVSNKTNATEGSSDDLATLQVPDEKLLKPLLASGLQQNSGTSSILWALKDCNDCSKNTAASAYITFVSTPGILPQALVPTIKNQIIQSKDLATYRELPLLLKDIIGIFYSVDEKINKTVQESLVKLLSNSNPQGSKIQQLVPKFKFELFQTSDSTTTFDVDSMAVKWNYVFKTNALWEGKEPVVYQDHSFQILSTAISLSEWTYMLGLDRDKNQNNSVAGGLAYPLKTDGTGSIQKLTTMSSFDPRVEKDRRGVLTGKYQIQFADLANPTSPFEAAFAIKETWVGTSDINVSLNEQTKIWSSAALAFNRLRPKNRSFTKQLYDYDAHDGILTNDAHLLPLIHLLSMQTLLENSFIDQTARRVYGTAQFKGSPVNDDASLLDLARLAQSLMLWIQEFSNLDDIKKDMAAEQVLSMQDSPVKLQKLLQLITSIMFSQYATYTSADQPDSLIGFRESKDPNNTKVSIANIGEVLTTLVKIERDILPSEYLQQKIIRLTYWYIKLLVTNVSSLKAEDIIWAQIYLKESEALLLKTGMRISPVQDLSRIFTRAVQSWEFSFGSHK